MFDKRTVLKQDDRFFRTVKSRAVDIRDSPMVPGKANGLKWGDGYWALRDPERNRILFSYGLAIYERK